MTECNGHPLSPICFHLISHDRKPHELGVATCSTVHRESSFQAWLLETCQLARADLELLAPELTGSRDRGLELSVSIEQGRV